MTKKSIMMTTVVLLTLTMGSLWAQGAVEYMEANPDLATEVQTASPALSSGLLPLPHLGDCTHDGQPASHRHEAIASRVAPSHAAAFR